MTDRNGGFDPDRIAFDRMIARPYGIDGRAPGTPSERPQRARTHSIRADLLFASGCFAVIFPMSIVVGGWIGVCVVIAALGVTLRMVLK